MRILSLSMLSFCLLLLTVSYNCYWGTKTKKTKVKKTNSVQLNVEANGSSVESSETFSLTTQQTMVSNDHDSPATEGLLEIPAEAALEQLESAPLSIKKRAVKKLNIRLTGNRKKMIGNKAFASDYGGRTDPLNKRKSFHKGVDISRPIGTDVYAWDKGVVKFAGWMRGYGRTIDIVHPDGVKTRYAHLEKILVAKGQRIQDGQTIGEVGRTGRATGPNLHFEVIVAGNSKDPNHYLENGIEIVDSLATNG